MLIIVLFFATTIALIVASLATLAFTSTTTAKVYTDRGKLVNALDGGIQAAVENARVATPQGCATPNVPLALSGANAINGYDVEVACTPPADPATDPAFTFDAHPLCSATPAASPPAIGITATATLSTIGGAGGPPIARVATWKVGPRMPCPTTPTP